MQQKQINSKQQVMNYVLDSEPDDDDSDDESRPKHEVPHWALRMYIFFRFEIIIKKN